jgi:predicted GIY-YIG superfamily endonuclease
MSYFLYVRQMSNGRLDVGTAPSLDQRFKQQVRPGESGDSSDRRMEQALYFESHPDREAAEKREREIRKWPKAKKLALMHGKVPD